MDERLSASGAGPSPGAVESRWDPPHQTSVICAHSSLAMIHPLFGKSQIRLCALKPPQLLIVALNAGGSQVSGMVNADTYK